ncbi:N-6 DNA methylase [Nonomuraea sp. NPDC049421]|uniref:N-6 DNA methylase n=1 Tax=Nonomuraea sp. NPDC049421 TaxID=3155275 RepID=UPI0034232B71
MRDDATVTAGDIARLAGVGRAAVSNWRRRFQDFPGPVGGTSSNPLFSLNQVESWLRSQGKLDELPFDERVWQQIRNSADDLQLLSVVSDVACSLVGGGTEPPADLADAASRLAAELGTPETVEFLYRRYVETNSRRVQVPSSEVAATMAALLESPDMVFDPHCGFGGLLVAALDAARRHAGRVFGQERDAAMARLAAARLSARGVKAEIRAGDSLTADAFPDMAADAAICIPPYSERGWGYEELTNDPRWQYGLPPRGESELAWVQHCLARVRPGGQVVVLMPPAAATRRSGRRIRSQLLRTGALQGIIGLPAGSAPQSTQPPHLWLLRRPSDDDAVPSQVLMADCELEDVLPAWRSYLEQSKGAMAIIDLLDDEVDLTPSRYLVRKVAPLTRSVDESRAELAALARELADAVPNVLQEPRALTMTTLGELIRAGAVQLEQTPMRMEIESGDVPLLTAKDVTLGRGPTGKGTVESGTITAQPGDVVIPAITRVVHARVITEEVTLGPHLFMIRVDQELFDPHFLAGFLRLSAERTASTMSGTLRVDVRRAQIPRLPLDEQRRYGEAFRQLEVYERAIDETARVGRQLAAQILEGLTGGALQPVTG